jgi:hypothetical protein
MGHRVRLTAVAAILSLLPLGAYAQERAFAGSFQYSDRNGPGTLTITPLAGDSTGVGVERVQVTLEQAGQRLNGVGAYYAPGGGTANLPALLSFGLIGIDGRGLYYQARLTTDAQGIVGNGTYFLIAEPQTEYSWSIAPRPANGGTSPAATVSGQPSFVGEWVRIPLAAAIGGVYFATDNQAAAPIKTATWRGGLPGAGTYRVEVFVPAQPEGAAPRTENAVYRISGGLAGTDTVRRASQNVTTSQWVDLGISAFGTTYEVVLTDETGEPAFTRSVVANAIRFTPASDAS